MEWISVKDRLPEKEQGCICTLFFEDIQESIIVIAYYRLNGEWYCSEYESLPWKVTHWMPLPSLPEELKWRQKDI